TLKAAKRHIAKERHRRRRERRERRERASMPPSPHAYVSGRRQSLPSDPRLVGLDRASWSDGPRRGGGVKQVQRSRRHSLLPNFDR
ncbi:hypothetical protein KIPB_014266, partial [Kipferlia bialata]